MERIGRILRWADGVATVEVGKAQQCLSGSCADCHAGEGEKWTLEVPWSRPFHLGQRVMVKPRKGLSRAFRWGCCLAVFCLVLEAGDAFFPGGRGGAEERWAVVLGIALGLAVWEVLRRAARGRPKYRVVPLEAADLELQSEGKR